MESLKHSLGRIFEKIKTRWENNVNGGAEVRLIWKKIHESGLKCGDYITLKSDYADNFKSGHWKYYQLISGCFWDDNLFLICENKAGLISHIDIENVNTVLRVENGQSYRFFFNQKNQG